MRAAGARSAVPEGGNFLSAEEILQEFPRVGRIQLGSLLQDGVPGAGTGSGAGACPAQPGQTKEHKSLINQILNNKAEPERLNVLSAGEQKEGEPFVTS